MYEKELQNLGLSEKEAKVYLAALESGAETAQNISKKSGINRATTYVQIESLKNKGLMSELEKGKKTLYVAESPDRLVSLINALQKNVELKRDEMGRILPVLSEIFAGAGERPKVRFLEGVEGARTLTEDFLSVKNKQVESFGNLDKLFEIFPKHEEDYSRKRITAGIRSKIIYTRRGGPIAGATDPSKLREAKFISSDRMPITADINIYDNKVAFATYKAKPISVIIESPEIAGTMRSLFYLIWNTLK